MSDTSKHINTLRELAISSLRRMYVPEHRLFVHHMAGPGPAPQQVGVSRRYTAITLLGLAEEPDHVNQEILTGDTARDVCSGLMDQVHEDKNIGDVALALWAARRLDHRDADVALQRLRALNPVSGQHTTVELAWCLSALSAASEGCDTSLTEAIADRLMRSCCEASGLFPHHPSHSAGRSMRSHVACFADLVYPILALAHYYALSRDRRALGMARSCASRMCAGQGPQGQWWWHHDVRTGQVLERYPVYAVHQDSMAPMALLDLQDVAGGDYLPAIERGIDWLMNPGEVSTDLVDTQAGIMWRKVARREPRKFVRRVQAISSRLHANLRMPASDMFFPPNTVDFESRPYHMGWILYAWNKQHTTRASAAACNGSEVAHS